MAGFATSSLHPFARRGKATKLGNAGQRFRKEGYFEASFSFEILYSLNFILQTPHVQFCFSSDFGALTTTGPTLLSRVL
jgi:hypothetical protein